MKKQKKKKKPPGPPNIVLKYEIGDLVSWQEGGRRVTGFILKLCDPKYNCVEVRARGDIMGSTESIPHIQLRMKREQVKDYWFWL